MPGAAFRAGATCWFVQDRGLTVREALTFGGLRSGIVLAGGHGLDHRITWVKVLESPETFRFVREGDLLLTVGYAFKDDPAAPVHAIQELAARSAAGIVIKPEPYLGDVPPAMREEADELAIPIVWLPERVAYAEVAVPIVERLVNREAALLRLSLDIHRRFTQLALNDEGVEAIVRTLAEIVQSSVVFLNPDFHVVASHTVAGKVDPLREQTLASGQVPPSVLQRLGISPRMMMDTFDDRSPRKVEGQPALGITTPRILAPVTAGANCFGCLSVMEDSMLPDELALAAVEHAATVLALELVKQRDVAQAEDRVRGELVDDLLSGTYGDEPDVVRRARYLRYDLSVPHLLLVVDVDQFALLIRARQYDERRVIGLKQQLLRVVMTVAARRYPRHLLTSRSDSIILLAPLDDMTAVKAAGRQLAEAIQEAVREADPGLRVSVAIGRPCLKPKDYRAAFLDAQRALEIMTRFGRREQVVDFERFGIDRLLAQIQDRRELEEFASHRLGPVIGYDEARGTPLLHTLEAYLRRHGNLLQAARDLHIHQNTLRYRLARITEMLEVDLRDEDERLDLLLALRVLALARSD